MTAHWTYKIVEVKAAFLGHRPEHVEEVLASHGKQGWELVQVVQMGTAIWLYLKKEA